MNKDFKKQLLIYGTLILVIIVLTICISRLLTQNQFSILSKFAQSAVTTVSRSISDKINFSENFEKRISIIERWPMKKSGNANWWVSSGAYLFFENGVGRTIVGDLSENDQWVEKFKIANAQDTNNGLRPQNIFRLVLKKTAKNINQSVYARIIYYDASQSPNRNASNGILLFNRYQDENTLYYTGVRVDGQIVVKKKLAGTYFTLGTVKVLDGQYDIKNNPNLIPLNTWFGIKNEVFTDDFGIVRIKVYTDIGKTGQWTLVLETYDDGKKFGKIISSSGYGGIRTDFMDVEFDNYKFSSQ